MILRQAAPEAHNGAHVGKYAFVEPSPPCDRRREAVPVILEALRLGVRYCDTAPAYQQSHDYHGEAFRAAGPKAREQVFSRPDRRPAAPGVRGGAPTCERRAAVGASARR